MPDRPPSDPASLVIASNRGPLAFARAEDGSLTSRRAAGGLASTLGALLAGEEATWVAAAMSDADREAARGGPADLDGVSVVLLDLDESDFRAAYDVVSNATLWFLNHGLFDLARRPWFDRRWRAAWESYRRVNEAFADAVSEAAAAEATVLVQDYHLALVGRMLAERRPDVTAVHFTHTPFDQAASHVLPADVAAELLDGMAGFAACGFHSPRWAQAFAQACETTLGSVPPTFVAPLGPDPADIGGVAAGEACAAAVERLRQEIGDRRFLVRVDRIELSKNILRGFHAFDELLAVRPEWRERVVFGAFVYPSREGLAEYLAYRNEVEAVAERINATHGTADWQPVLLETDDDFPRSVAALRLYDVLLVNPVRDGLNLVAKEGPLVNEADGVLVLSERAGAYDEMGDVALVVNPYDVGGTAEALHRALSMGASERRDHAAAVRRVAVARTPRHWLDDQLAAARR